MGIRVLLLPALLLLLLLVSASSCVLRSRDFTMEVFNAKPWPNMHPPSPGGLGGRGGEEDKYGSYGGKL